MADLRTTKGESTYKAAAAVADRVVHIFTKHLEEAAAKGETELSPVPSSQHVEQILNTAFWASLRREEGNSPRVSIAFLSPEQTELPLRFEHKLTFSPDVITKLGPGVERAGVYVGVWYDENGLYIWGTTFKIPNYCFVLDVSEPGQLVIKHRRSNGFGKFTNIVVLIGDQIKIVDEDSRKLPDCPALLTSLLGFSAARSNASVNILIELATSMRAHKQGGSLLVVPSGSDAWRESIIHPLKYSISPPFRGLSNLLKREAASGNDGEWKGELSREINGIAGLTAIDGATIITDRHEVLAFGAKINRRKGSPRVESMLATEPIVGGEGLILNPAISGGTRHMSAAQFVHDQKEAIALVASQDGIFTVFTWSTNEGLVHAHRIDSLLL